MKPGEKLTDIERARGRWRAILPRVGIGLEFLTRKNGPCPLCGGKDRWRFLDYEGSGMWVCNRCRPDGGTGFDLLMLKLGCDFATACRFVRDTFGVKLPPREKPPTNEDHRDRCRWTWEHASPLADGDVATTYLRSRAITLDRWPLSLRSRGDLLVAKIISPANEPVNLWCRNIPTRDRKFMRGKIPNGSAVRLFRPQSVTLGIAEGIETALSAHLMFNVPTWSLLHKEGVAAFVPPSGITKVIIFGDNDQNGVGQEASERGRRSLEQLGIVVEIKIPEREGWDWNDVLMRQTCDRENAV